MIFSRSRTKFSKFHPAIFALLAINFLGVAPALGQGEDEIFQYLIPLAEAVNLMESGQHEQAISKTKRLLTNLGSKRDSAWFGISKEVRRPLPVLRDGTSGGDTYQQLQAEALALRGISSFALNRGSQAITDLKLASTLCPNHAYILSDFGTVYVKSKKPKEGIAVLTRAIKLNQNIREAYFMRALGYQQIGKDKESQADLARSQKVFSEQQNKIDSLTERIDKLVRENKIGEAINLDRQLLQIAPRDGLVLTGYADHLMSNGQYKDALNYVSTSIALDSSIGYSYRIRSVINGHLQKFDLQLQDANIAFNIEPRSAQALNSRAIANLEADQPVQAIRDFDLLIKRKPDFADAYINRSTAYLRIGEFERAIKDAKQAVLLVPTSPYGYQCLGAASRRGGKLNEAREALETSFRYSKNASTDTIAMAQFNLGAVLLALKDPKGNEHLDAAIKLSPSLPEVFLQRGTYNASLGKVDNAIRILTRSSKHNSNKTTVSKLTKVQAPKPSISALEMKAALIKAAKAEILKRSTAPKPIVPLNKTVSTKPISSVGKPPTHKSAVPSTATTAKTLTPASRKIQTSTLDLQDCLLVANRVIEIAPNKLEAYYVRGLANLCLRQYDQAIHDFRKLADLTKTGTLYERALILTYLALERIGKTDEARDFLQLNLRKFAGTAGNSSTSSNGQTDSDGPRELRFFNNEIKETDLLAGKRTTKELTRIHSLLGFHFKSIADSSRASTHVSWVLDQGNVSSPELVLSAFDGTQSNAGSK